jgi:MoaA/NifB/PqqE/SkfB family radical SAM enzyme
MKRKQEFTGMTPITLGEKCNQSCVYCSATGGMWRPQGPAELARLIRGAGGAIGIGGWEPTVEPALVRVVSLARKAGISRINLFTNGVRLADRDYIQRLISAGVTTFDVSFPSHLEALSDSLTRSPGAFRRRVTAIKNILKAPGEKYVSLVFVINSRNYRTMPRYAEYVAREFPGVTHVLLNMICVFGEVEKKLSLVPRFERVKPYLASALAAFSRHNIKCLTDNLPLCLIPGFEYSSVDARQIAGSGTASRIPGKAHQKECGACGLIELCPGPREDLVRVPGAVRLEPSEERAEDVARAIRQREAAHL